MTATQPVPTLGTHPQMAPDADSRPDPTAPAPATAVRTAPGLWSKLTDNPLLTILGTAAVGLLIFTLTRTEHRISRLEDKVDAGFAAVDARFAAQDAKIAELDLRLTTQIAELDLRLTTQNAEVDLRLTTQIAELDLKIAELDLKLTAQIAELDLKLTALIAELDQKLTALIAALNATDEISAALEGRLLDYDASDAEPSAAPPGSEAERIGSD